MEADSRFCPPKGLPVHPAALEVNSARAIQFRQWATGVLRDYAILDHPGKVSREVAKAFAESEFEKYRIVQDRLFESDFDRRIKKLLE
jgi:hypothetical protein